MARCPSPLALAVRVTNLVVLAIGLALLAYGAYVAAEYKSISVLSGTALALGAIDSLMGLLSVACFKRLFVLRLYGLVMGLILLAQIAVAVLFSVDSTQQKVIDAAGVPDDQRAKLESNLSTCSYVLVAVTAFQVISLVLVFWQSCKLDRGFDEESYDQESLLGGSLMGRGGGDKFGALSDEVLPSAKDRYREKHEAYYTKYASARYSGK